MKVGVFCSASDSVSPIFLAEIEHLGEALSQDGHQIVYGGATPGCMGALARGVLRSRGHLIGVVPQMDFMEGLVEPQLSEVKTVPTLSSRKQVMLEIADAMVVFPGGLGTLDEAFEALALKATGSLGKPIIFYNFLGVWSPLLESLELLHAQNLIKSPLDRLIRVIDKSTDLRQHLRDGV